MVRQENDAPEKEESFFMAMHDALPEVLQLLQKLSERSVSGVIWKFSSMTVWQIKYKIYKTGEIRNCFIKSSKLTI